MDRRAFICAVLPVACLRPYRAHVTSPPTTTTSGPPPRDEAALV